MFGSDLTGQEAKWTVLQLVLLLVPVIGVTVVERNLPCGRVSGTSSQNVNSFLGIPYAEPPQRFQKPLPVKDCSSSGKTTGPSCFQKPIPGIIMSEDCLHLNIYTPTLSSSESPSLLPVAVYLHGGSLVEGSSTAIQAGYGGPSTLPSLKNSIVSISLNYRLGVLGFLALEGMTGNYGFLDVVQALKWIQTNVEHFGGDPNKVTVYGQSSGGSLVFALMTSPYATGLFQRAISMSGSPRLNSTLQEASKYWHPQLFNGLQSTACSKNQTISCLLQLAPSTLTLAQPPNWDPSNGWSARVFWDSYSYAPLLVIDGDVLPSDYRSPLSESHPKQKKTPLNSQVPLIIGVTREEIDFAPGNDVRNMSFSDVATLFDTTITNSTNATPFVQDILQSYSLSTNPASTLIPVQGRNATSELIFSDFISDATMLCGTYVLADEWSKISSNIYMYTVSQRPGNPFCALSSFQKHAYCPMYSFHAIDMFAMFDWLPTFLTPGHAVLYNTTSADVAFTSLIRERLVDAFMVDGIVPAWSKYTANGSSNNVAVLNVDNERMLEGWRKEQCTIFMKHGYYDTKVWVN